MTICCSLQEAAMSNSALEAVIHEHCRELKLAAFTREYPALCRRAQDGGQPYQEFLRELLEAEVISRRQSTARRLLREAHFPDVKRSTKWIGKRSRASRNQRSSSWRAVNSSLAPRA